MWGFNNSLRKKQAQKFYMTKAHIVPLEKGNSVSLQITNEIVYLRLILMKYLESVYKFSLESSVFVYF